MEMLQREDRLQRRHLFEYLIIHSNLLMKQRMSQIAFDYKWKLKELFLVLASSLFVKFGVRLLYFTLFPFRLVPVPVPVPVPTPVHVRCVLFTLRNDTIVTV